MTTTKKMFNAAIVIAAMCLSACSSNSPRAELPANTNTANYIQEAEQNLQKAYSEQWDVVAGTQTSNATKHLNSAKELQKKGKDNKDIVEKLELYQGSFNEAQNLAQQRKSKFQGLLTAREEALNSGARALPKGSDRLYDLDQDFRSMTVKSSEVDVKDFDTLQAKYYQLAADSKKHALLATAKKNIADAKENRAGTYAPSALNAAEIDFKSAENTITTNLNKPEAYNAALDKANRSAAMVYAISAEQKKVKFNLDETAARKMVNQKIMMDKLNADLEVSRKQIENSKNQLAASQLTLEEQEARNREAQQILTEQQSKLSAQQQALTAQQSQLQEQGSQLANAEAEKRFQSVLESARKEFSAEEADVYRQGDRLLIRLKKIEFASGDSKLPDQSKTLINKVTTVAQQLGPKQVTVEGHTDSVGSAQVNESLSKKRADTVAQYMTENGVANQSIEAVGYGFKKPLTDNKTKESRAQNRRVDVWITPDAAQLMKN